MAITRRVFSVCSTALLTAFPFSSPAFAALNSPRERFISLYNLHTGESLNKLVYWQNGRYITDSLMRIDFVLRDHRNDEVHPIDPAVLDLLYRLQQKTGIKQAFQIISGYRSPHSNAVLASLSDGVATRSLHMSGQAVDIRLPGLSVQKLGSAAAGFRAGGVGIYDQSQFVHIDTGRVRYW